MWRIEFSSDQFLPRLPEQCQENPGVYGLELAWWLAQALASAGLATSYPLGEDWGWFLEHITPSETELTIGCGSVAEEGEGYRNEPIAWSIFIRPHTSLRQRLQGISHDAEVQRLGQAVISALQSQGIEAASSAA